MNVLEWDQILVGTFAKPTSINITKEMILNYKKSIEDNTAGNSGELLQAPAGMFFIYAPARRLDVMHENGFISPEEAETNSRSTPFVGTDIEWLGNAIKENDIITSTAFFEKKWESSSGNRFLSIGVEAKNQTNEPVINYRYNVMWEFSKGQKARTTGANQTASTNISTEANSFDINNITEGDIIPQLQRIISQETINKYHELNNWSNKEPSPTALLHVDEAFAEATVFSGTTLSGPTAVGFMLHLVEKTFGQKAIINSTFNERALEPVRPGDIITYSGKVITINNTEKEKG
jgi:Acyl dehydratase